MKLKKSVIANGLQVVRSICAVKMGKRIPLYCEWEVTDRCNMNCSFCGTRKSEGSIARDISRAEALSLVEQLSKLGTKIIHFTGGEPTLREDLRELVGKAKEKNMIVQITTNGSCPIQKMDRLLLADVILISIDGTEQFHDSIRNSPGAFKRAMQTLQFLKSKNKKPIITCVYTKESSYKMAEELVDVARSLDIRITIKNLGRNINETMPEAMAHPEYNDLKSEYFAEYISVVHKLRKEYKNTVVNPEPLSTVIGQGGLDAYGCRAMDIAISIKADGSISLPCNGLQIRLLKGKIESIYHGKEALELRPLQGNHPICKGCNIPCMVGASALLRLRGLFAIIGSYLEDLF